MNTLILAVDRLHIGYLGAFGNTWIQTPSLDRLALESMVFDEYLLSDPRLESVYLGLWDGRHGLAPAPQTPDPPSLPAVVASANNSSALLTDEPGMTNWPPAAHFQTVLDLVEPAPEKPADQLHQTHLARLFGRLVQWLDQEASDPYFVWCHMGSLGGPWDAPMHYRQQYQEAGDPEPMTGVQVPDRAYTAQTDPDELWRVALTYAGQVSLWDQCLGGLLEYLDSCPPDRQAVVALLSLRGLALGEHGWIGPSYDALYNELVHVPLMIRFPDRFGAGARSRVLVQPADVCMTLLELSGLPSQAGTAWGRSLMRLIREEAEESEWGRDRVCLVGPQEQRALRTPAWYLRQASRLELFLKPDDFWEANDVADRCPEVVHQMQEALDNCVQAIRSGRPEDLLALSEVLRLGLE